jgi:carboxyl-terminal processing protease
MAGLVLDLRFNPGGRLDEAKEVCDLFLESGHDRRHPRAAAGRRRVAYAKPEGTLPHFPMAVLVNGHSASASEIVAAA